jgi:hypothetical protein
MVRWRFFADRPLQPRRETCYLTGMVRATCAWTAEMACGGKKGHYAVGHMRKRMFVCTKSLYFNESRTSTEVGERKQLDPVAKQNQTFLFQIWFLLLIRL